MMNLVQLSFGLRNYEETVGGLYIIAVIAAIRAVPCEAQTDEIAFTHVAVVDVQSGNISPDMTVLISDTRRFVRSVLAELFTFQNRRIPLTLAANTSSPAFGTCTSTACGMPSGPYVLPPFLANGVTGVREMGGPMPARSGTLARPGRFRRGDWPSPGRPVPSRSGLLQGLHRRSRAAYFDIAVEVKKENFPFLGHVPLEVGVDEASKRGKKASSTRPYLKELQASNDPRLKYIPKSVAGDWGRRWMLASQPVLKFSPAESASSRKKWK